MKSIWQDRLDEAKRHPERVGIVSKQFEVGPPIEFHVLYPYRLGQGEMWVKPVAIDAQISASIEFLHCGIDQSTSMALRKIRERVCKEYAALDDLFHPNASDWYEARYVRGER